MIRSSMTFEVTEDWGPTTRTPKTALSLCLFFGNAKKVIDSL